MNLSPAALRYLADLQRRLIRVFLLAGVAIIVLYFQKETLLGFLMNPLVELPNAPDQLVVMGVPELFFIYLKVCTWGGVFLALPYLLTEVWQFLSPGLYRHEKIFLRPIFIAIPALFYAGGAFSYFFVTPLALDFFMSFHQPGLLAMPSLREYLSFLFTMAFAMGFAFNLPVFLIGFIKIGLLTVEQLRSARRFVIVAIFIAAAVLTPPDPISQCVMALALWALYEAAIVMARWLKI